MGNPGVGAAREAARSRRVRYARPLVDEGFTFRPLIPQDWPAVNGLVREHIVVPGEWTVTTDNFGMVIKDSEDTLVAAVVTQIFTFDGKTMLMVSHLVTDPQHRGRGMATILLSMLDNIADTAGAPPPSMTVGFCAQDGIRLYRRAGFEVGDANSYAEPEPGLSFPRFATSNSSYPYPFFRAW